eukprot:TRINITY_DN21598_c0_g1_i2.p1 TRINITY_DN21598_c0_g1~~TRINITY_DN21598_c0_g1_i2.p1  ORF type:complete len:484 (+),score=140.81 TRINITY_DN21598_c0_g1_i2:73-1452(+)
MGRMKTPPLQLQPTLIPDLMVTDSEGEDSFLCRIADDTRSIGERCSVSEVIIREDYEPTVLGVVGPKGLVQKRADRRRKRGRSRKRTPLLPTPTPDSGDASTFCTAAAEDEDPDGQSANPSTVPDIEMADGHADDGCLGGRRFTLSLSRAELISWNMVDSPYRNGALFVGRRIPRPVSALSGGSGSFCCRSPTVSSADSESSPTSPVLAGSAAASLRRLAELSTVSQSNLSRIVPQTRVARIDGFPIQRTEDVCLCLARCRDSFLVELVEPPPSLGQLLAARPTSLSVDWKTRHAWLQGYWTDVTGHLLYLVDGVTVTLLMDAVSVTDVDVLKEPKTMRMQTLGEDLWLDSLRLNLAESTNDTLKWQRNGARFQFWRRQKSTDISFQVWQRKEKREKKDKKDASKEKTKRCHSSCRAADTPRRQSRLVSMLHSVRGMLCSSDDGEVISHTPVPPAHRRL